MKQQSLSWARNNESSMCLVTSTAGADAATNSVPIFSALFLVWKQTIFGQACSKSNSRFVAYKWIGTGANRKKIPFFPKSQEAQQYEKDFIYQVEKKPRIEGNLALVCDIYYQSRRNDLDESVIMDCLQKAGVIRNDRQIREKLIRGFVDPANPRAAIEIWRI